MRKKYDPSQMGWNRSPRTAQEKRANGKRSKWARGRRASHNLPSTWDDVYVHTEKSWKGKRNEQYKVGGRGKKHHFYVPYEGLEFGYLTLDYTLQG